MGTTKAESPRWPAAGSVLANTTVHAAWPALEMKVFEPLSTYSSPRRTAVVLMRATSDPASGSVSPKAQRIGSSSSGVSHWRFCSSLPASSTGPEPSVLAVIETAMPAQPQESSSPISIPSKPGRPRPPYSWGTCGFISPTSCALATTSAGCVECSSYSAARGRISRSANSRASSRSAFCSSDRANEMPVATGCAASMVATASSSTVD